ncbi:AraC family transcriptional regulator [Niallia oryzisoli]|uniref:AraC family transcriptional regulator n=1 Tax=Niallia oryzisoli TaxID=1737571 RepID=UPI0037359751
MEELGVLKGSRSFFHTSSCFAKKALFYLYNAGSYVCSELYQTKRDRFEQFLFLYIKKGKMEIHYKDHKYIANENTFVFLDCYHPHLYKTVEESEFEWIHFDGNSSRAYFDYLFQKHGCVFSLENSSDITDFMNRILSMMETDKVDEHGISILIHRILYELERISNKADHTLEETIKTAVSFIESNYNKDITLNDIADHVKISPYHFSRLFKKQTNYTPHQYLIDFRINNAKKLLFSTNHSINEIAFKCGFNSVTHFVTTFKNHTNYSPKKYREFLLKI